MSVAKSIPAEHKDLIHDVAYDFHGRRMATCSSDQCVKVSKTPSTLKICDFYFQFHHFMGPSSGCGNWVSWTSSTFGQVITDQYTLTLSDKYRRLITWIDEDTDNSESPSNINGRH